jgi:CBS domain-containing protein
MWALLGMAAVMSAAMRAPLTSAIFAIELTGRFELLPATAAAAVAAYALAVLVLKRSILTEKISRRGRHILQEYTVDPLALSQAGEIMTKEPETLAEDMTVADAVSFFETAKHRSYPVIDAAGRPIALASRSDALRWRQAEIAPEVTLRDQLSDSSLPAVRPETPAIAVANLMITEEIGRVCVVAPEDGRIIGLIARRNLLAARATKVREERVRHRTRTLPRRPRRPA